ncbi:MAG: hypothetical protein GWN80_01420, partial [Gammaproteobacteria bacterium]|nr:hypothetical protein [Gammaproteobacteria bacterium]
MADIDLSGLTGTSFNIIGSDYDNTFAGVFDGNGHTISNFNYTSIDKSHIGLFGFVKAGQIKNLGLIDPNIYAGTGNYVGSLVGRLSGGAITGCYVKGGCVLGHYNVGGLVGKIYSTATITNCYAISSVKGWSHVGGLVGYNSGNSITNCCSNGSVLGTAHVGGLVGSNGGTITNCITNCYSTGSASGEGHVGGLVGANIGRISNCYSTGDISGDRVVGGLVGGNGGTITNCYSTGSVSGDERFGGLVGSSEGTVSASFWDFQTSSPSTSAGGVGLTTAEMQTASTFIAWGCENGWTIEEGVDYPRLVWENAPGESITTPSYGGGSGEPNDPYLIYTAEQLNTIGLVPCHLDKHFLLCADIDLDTLPPPPPPHHPPSLFKASKPNPAHGAYPVSATADLSWTPGLGAKS